MQIDKLYEKINSMLALELFNYDETQKTIENDFYMEFLFLNNMNNDLFIQEDDATQLKILNIYDIFFRNGKPLITDNHYDGFYKIYSDSQLEPIAPIMFEPSVSAWKKVEHDLPMGSLDKQTTIEEIEKWNTKKGIAGKSTVVSDKLDGISCLHFDALLELSDGTLRSIKELVDTKSNELVKTFNHKTKEIEFKQIIAHQAKPNTNGKKWLKVKVCNENGVVSELITTEDHLWFDSSSSTYKEISKFKIGEKIFFSPQ